jgi:hypothetical protein
MAIHSKTENMLRESLEEILIAAGTCIDYKKENGGCLGYVAALLLFSIADTIGSYYEGNEDYKIMIDKKQRTIDSSGFKHLFIFNSSYYDFQLSEETIKKIYDNYRSLLVHNGVIASGHFIFIDDPLRRPFADDFCCNEVTGEKYPSIHLKPLFVSTRLAVHKFFKQIDKVVPNSKQASNIAKKIWPRQRDR